MVLADHLPTPTISIICAVVLPAMAGKEKQFLSPLILGHLFGCTEGAITPANMATALTNERKKQVFPPTPSYTVDEERKA